MTDQAFLLLSEALIVMFSQKKVLVVTQSEVQYIIQERMKELQELKHNVDVLKVRSVIASPNTSNCVCSF